MKLSHYVFGTGRYTLTGADPALCLNRFSDDGIDLWQVEKKDDFTLTFSAPLSKESHILTLAERAYCEGVCTHKSGLGQDVMKLLHRPFLILSVLGALILTFFFESIIWKIQIKTDDSALESRIRYVLQESGIEIWSKTENLDPQELRYTLLNQIPELSWVAVNPRGGKVTVLAFPKETTENRQEETGPAHLVAARDGVITEAVILDGMALVKVGDSVTAGQLLVSGYEDYGLYLKAVRAQGEIYGQTWHSGTLVTPSKRQVKQYTGRTWTETAILFGRKLINLSGSSSNLGVTCDKIIDTEQFSLPGYSFPLSLQRVTYREYTLIDLPLDPQDAQNRLHTSWEDSLRSSMVAGRVEETAYDCFEQGGYYIYHGESICHELLSRPMSPEPSKKGDDPIGTDH